MALAFGLGLNVTALILWWVAAFNGWEVNLIWDMFNEQWIEGITLHASIWLFVCAFVSVVRE
mgnify:CR=1 FL=1